MNNNRTQHGSQYSHQNQKQNGNTNGHQSKQYHKPKQRTFVTVSAVARHMTKIVTSQPHFLRISIRGEISNYKPYTPRGKKTQYFFDIKDQTASIKCISYLTKLFTNIDGGAKYKDGDDIIATGQITYYEKTGYISFKVSHIEKVGQGLLHQNYLLTKEKLVSEGIFDHSKKKRIKPYPSSIGIVTARTSAACADVERTIQRRSKFSKMVFFDTIVQGVNAPKSIINSLKVADKMKLDVIIMCRGGGSEEDLFCFSEEAVVRQVAAMKTPIVTGIGHEVDTSLSDLASDRRASTPTAAAESVTYVEADMLEDIDNQRNYFERNMKKILKSKVEHFEKDFLAIQRGINTRIQRMNSICDNADHRALREIQHRNGRLSDRFNRISRRISFETISSLINNKLTLMSSSLESLRTTRTFALGQKLGSVKNMLDNYDNIIKMTSPNNIIKRGFAAVESKDGTIIKETASLAVGQGVSLRMRDGIAEATINNIKKEEI